MLIKKSNKVLGFILRNIVELSIYNIYTASPNMFIKCSPTPNPFEPYKKSPSCLKIVENYLEIL